MKNRIKGVLSSNHYHCTVRQSTKETDDDGNESLRLVWTIDEDIEHAWRNLIETFPMDDDYGLARLYRTCDALNFNPYPPEHPEFYDQFIGLRTKANVTIKLSGNFRTNVILEHLLPTQPPHFDVTKPKTDDHYFHTNSKRKLPI